MVKKFVAIVCFAFLLVGSCASAGNDYLQGQAYFEDTTNSLTLDQVKREEFTPYDGWLTKGFRPSTYWIRLDVRPSEQDLVLRIRPAHIESIELFDLSALEPKGVTGAKYQASDADIKAFNHNFNLGFGRYERQIYLKIKSTRTYILNFEVMTLPEFLDIEQTTSLFFVAYIVFTFSLGLWLLGAWFSNREIVLGLFVIQQFISFLHSLFLFGYARIFFNGYIDQSIINFITHVTVVVYPLAGLLANKFLFKEYSLKRFYTYFFNGGICISIGIIAMLMAGQTGLALKLNATLVMWMAMLFCVTAFFGTNARGQARNINLPISILRIYYTFNLLIWVMVALPVLGIISSGELAVHANFIYSALSGLLFCWILQYRAKLILKNETLKSAALKEEIEYERLRREDQGKLMSMLTHEIRTPLSVLKLVVDRKVTGSDLEDFANRAVSNIDSIIDKCIQLDRLELNVLQVDKRQFNFLVLLNSVISDTQMKNRFSILGQVDIDIESDMDILSIVVSNLLGNAVKYSPPKTDILIHSEILHDHQLRRLQFSVQNVVGIAGVPDPELAFDKYYRSPSAAKVSGSGLGLFLVKELVNALNGEVKLSTQDNLITFMICIPV